MIPSAVNLGFAAGVNLAARHARGSFLLLLNPDTIIEGPIIAVLEEWLCCHPDTAVAGPRVLNGDGSIQPSARAFPGFSTLFGGRSAWMTQRYPNNPWSRRHLLGLDTREPLDADWLSGSCLMTRRDVFERLGGWTKGSSCTGRTLITVGASANSDCGAHICPRFPSDTFAVDRRVQRRARDSRVPPERSSLYRKHGGFLGRIGSR